MTRKRPLAFHLNKGGRTNTALSKQHSALFGRCEKSERIRPARTVTVVAVVLTATENPQGQMRVVRFRPCFIKKRKRQECDALIRLLTHPPSPQTCGEGKGIDRWDPSASLRMTGKKGRQGRVILHSHHNITVVIYHVTESDISRTERCISHCVAIYHVL
jgi:hypothetical protein